MLHVCSVRRRADRQKMGVPSLQNRHQKRVVEWPSLNSPKQSGGDGRCWANLQNTHFSGLTRKNPVFERSVLKYVSIKNRILTPSGQKSRVCVNQPDRLLPHHQIFTLLLHKQIPKHARHGGDFYFLARKNGFLCRECTPLVLDRNKRPF